MSDERIAIVTGAAQGVGLVTASTLAQLGYRTILTDIQSLDSAVEKLKGQGSKVEPSPNGAICIAPGCCQRDRVSCGQQSQWVCKRSQPPGGRWLDCRRKLGLAARRDPKLIASRHPHWKPASTVSV
jgi:NAD(P)-dependent dehydrogenase (short-subunit alcohol dehydrogenase family)